MVIIEILIQVYHLLIPCFSMNDCNHYTSTSSISYVQNLKSCLVELAIQKWFKYNFPKHNKVQWKDGGANHLSTSKRFFLKNFSWRIYISLRFENILPRTRTTRIRRNISCFIITLDDAWHVCVVILQLLRVNREGKYIFYLFTFLSHLPNFWVCMLIRTKSFWCS